MEVVKFQNDPAIVIKSRVDTHSDKSYSWCLYKTDSKEIAEDLVHDTFMEGRRNHQHVYAGNECRNKSERFEKNNFFLSNECFGYCSHAMAVNKIIQ